MSWRRIAFLPFTLFALIVGIGGSSGPGILLAVLAIALVLPWPFLFTIGPGGGKMVREEYRTTRQWLTVIAIALVPVSMMVTLSQHANTPEGKAASAQREREYRIENAMDAARERAEKVAEEAERERERAFGLHCASPWDGAYRPLVQAVQPELRNPDSFDHVETSFSRIDEAGNHRVIMTFRAENGFGGLNLSTAYALMRGEDCAMLSWEFGD